MDGERKREKERDMIERERELDMEIGRYIAREGDIW